jgi:hypothetical protein
MQQGGLSSITNINGTPTEHYNKTIWKKKFQCKNWTNMVQVKLLSTWTWCICSIVWKHMYLDSCDLFRSWSNYFRALYLCGVLSLWLSRSKCLNRYLLCRFLCLLWVKLLCCCNSLLPNTKKISRREIQKQEEQLYRLGIDNGKTCQPKLMVFMHLINENTKSKELIVCSFCSQHFRGPFQNIIWSHSKGNE